MSAVALAASWIYWNGFKFEPQLALGAVVFATLILAGDHPRYALATRISSVYGMWA